MSVNQLAARHTASFEDAKPSNGVTRPREVLYCRCYIFATTPAIRFSLTWV